MDCGDLFFPAHGRAAFIRYHWQEAIAIIQHQFMKTVTIKSIIEIASFLILMIGGWIHVDRRITTLEVKLQEFTNKQMEQATTLQKIQDVIWKIDKDVEVIKNKASWPRQYEN